MDYKLKSSQILRYVILAIFIIILSFSFIYFDVNLISDFFYNVVDRLDNMAWYSGSTLLYHLESVYIGSDRNHVQARFPVQWVIRPHSDEHHDFRAYADLGKYRYHKITNKELKI